MEGGYQEEVQAALEEVEPEAEALPCAHSALRTLHCAVCHAPCQNLLRWPGQVTQRPWLRRCACANVENCLVGVVRWQLAVKKLTQCAEYVLEQLKEGTTVYLHCTDGVGRTSVVTAVVVAILGGLSDDGAMSTAASAHACRMRAGSTESALTPEQRRLTIEILSKLRAQISGDPPTHPAG